ncbi:MAG: hypothetical protein ACHQX3_12335 [Nitrospirales bacterium]
MLVLAAAGVCSRRRRAG